MGPGVPHILGGLHSGTHELRQPKLLLTNLQQEININLVKFFSQPFAGVRCLAGYNQPVLLEVHLGANFKPCTCNTNEAKFNRGSP